MFSEKTSGSPLRFVCIKAAQISGKLGWTGGGGKFEIRNPNIEILHRTPYGVNKYKCLHLSVSTSLSDFGRVVTETLQRPIFIVAKFLGVAAAVHLWQNDKTRLSVCGCVGFMRDVTGAESVKNVIIADYTNLDNRQLPDIEDMLNIDQSVQDQIEHNVSEKVAMQICSRLAKNESEIESMIRTGYNLAKNMSWDIVMKNYLLSSLQKALHKQPSVDGLQSATRV